MWKNLFILIVVVFRASHCFSDIGKWDLPLSGENCVYTLAKSLFKDTKVYLVWYKENSDELVAYGTSIWLKKGGITKKNTENEPRLLKFKVHCDVTEVTNLTITYEWFPTPCSPDYMHYFEQEVVQCPSSNRAERSLENNTNSQMLSVQQTHTCHSKDSLIFNDEKSLPPGNKKSDDDATSQSKIPPLLTVDKEGIYVLRMTVRSSNNKFNGTVHIEMVAPSGYLSAAIWPLLPFFGTMCGVYTVLCSGWLAVCALQWRDLLRIQYWIGGVALLGMLETATYYGVYSAINRSGYFNVNVYMFAEWISIAKRALARMLVIIVSLGFGIVKPRLGPALQRVVGTGVIWGVLAAMNAWLRLHHKESDSNRDLLLSEVPLALVDSAICWWVFVSLAHTMRTLQLRRNSIKLSLYRHFTNTLIFAVISSVVFMLYSIKSYRVLPCITDWKEVWMDEAYWHILFASVLTVIMVLWRPTNNNQRYAFTPLLDNAEDDDEEEEQFVNDAYGVKMRGTNQNTDNNDSQDPPANSLDSDLRWVEENIPTSTLPLLDSDEEIINTKFEVSKMQ